MAPFGSNQNNSWAFGWLEKSQYYGAFGSALCLKENKRIQVLHDMIAVYSTNAEERPSKP